MDEQANTIIEDAVAKIVELFSPSMVIEYNTKYDMEGELTSFKLCVVGPIGDKRKMLAKIYDEIDSEIPYDVLLYTDEQFDELKDESTAFAARIHKKGRVRYGK